MSPSTQAIVFNAVPLFLLAAVYLGAAASLMPVLRTRRAQTELLDLVPALTFPALGVAALIWGVVVLLAQTPVGGHVWPSFAGIVLALLPPLVAVTRRRALGAFAAGPLLEQEAQEERASRDRNLESASRLSNTLARTEQVDDVARAFLQEAAGLFQVDFVALLLVSEDGGEARGLLALREGEDWPWWRDVRIDLRHEPSAIASAVYEASALAVYDVESSSCASSWLAEMVGAKSAAFVPLVAGEHVIAVLSLATLDARRAFSTEELLLLETLAAETATALDRVRSVAALAQALERERLVTTISRRLRSELDLEGVLRIAADETARALGASCCFVTLGELGRDPPAVAEWREPELAPVGDPSAVAVADLAALEQRTIAVADVRRSDEIAGSVLDADLPEAPGSRAVLATPLVVLDQVMGVLALHRREAGEWEEREILVAEAVAHELGLAVHVRQLLRQNREQVARQGSLLRAARVLTGELELESVLQRLADQVAELLGGDAADCYRHDGTHGVLRCAAVRGLPPELVGLELPLGAGLAGEAIQRGRPVIATSHQELREPVHEAYAGFAGAAVAPVRWNDEVQGVLGVYLRGDKRSFDPSAAEVLEAFAGLASLALHNAETFAQNARQARVQQGFYRVASLLGQSLSRKATLDAIAHAAAEALGGEFAAVLMSSARRLELEGSFELPAPLASFLGRGLDEETVLTRVAAEGRILAAPSVAVDERFADAWRELAVALPYTGLLSVPLETPRDGVDGLVLVFFTGARVFTDDDLDLARHLAGAAGGALERSDLYEAERASRTLAQQLARTGGLLATELDPAAVLEEVAQQAPALLGADACAIRVLENDELVVSAAGGSGADAALGARSPAVARLSGDVVQSGTPIAIADASREQRLLDLDPMLAAGHRSFLGVPLVGPEGSLHGVLAVYGRRPRDWQAEEIEALRALAANTSAALSNAELYQRVALEKERSFAILANIADGIVAVDRDGYVVLWNAAAEAITGVPAIEALGSTTARVLQRALESEGAGGPGDRLVSIQRNGEEVWLSLTEAVMRDPAGAVAGRIFAFRDISADRLVEQMKSDFVSAVSHELRTPLTSIYGFAETLLRQDVSFGDEERHLFLSYIASESQRLTAIVDALLNVARLETGDLQVNLGPTDVGEVVSEVVAGVRRGNGHEFVLDLPDEPLSAEADRDKLRQVFSILLDNAVKYSPAGGKVMVGAARRQKTIQVSVVDEGPGIPRMEQDRIFRKFYRGADASGRLSEAGGTGLGLFIAQGLVSAMGGKIWVISGEGRGSSFGFELPLAQVPDRRNA